MEEEERLTSRSASDSAPPALAAAAEPNPSPESESEPQHHPNPEPNPEPEPEPEPKTTTPAVSADTPTAADNPAATPAATATFGVSTDGTCPYCRSSWVRYLVLVDPADEAATHSAVLTELLAKGYATKVQATPEIPEPSSFTCNSCQYGFNLDWNRTSLEQVFYYALSAGTAPTDPAHWSDARTQWALTQQHWHGSGPSKSEVDARAFALETVLDKIDNTGACAAGDGAAAGLTAASGPASTPHQHRRDPPTAVLRRCKWECGVHAPAVGGGGCWAHREGSCPDVHSDQPELLAWLTAQETASGGGPSAAGGAARPRYVTDFHEYSATANFTAMRGGFSKQSNDEYWAEKGVSKNRDLRMLGHFMDASFLVEAPAPNPDAKRRKLSKEELQRFKEKKKRRKFERDTAYLRS